MSLLRSLRLVAVAITAVVLAAPLAAQNVRENITAQQLKALLDEKGGMTTTINEKGNVIATVGSSKVVYFINGQTIQAYYGVSGTSMNVQRINDWNKGKRWGRAYIDNENDPVVELDYDLEGGVTDNNIKVWVDTVNSIVSAFRTHVSGR
jgi:hypothetical protein